MAQINKPKNYFNTVLYTGNNGSNRSITGVGFQPSFVWNKNRSASANHNLWNEVTGITERLTSSGTQASEDYSSEFLSFDSDGVTITQNAASLDINNSSYNYVLWNWLAGGTAPSKTYTVKVVDDSGNKYRFDDFGTSAVTLDLQEGGTFRFDQSDSSNSGHPLRFSTTSDGTHGGGSEYTTGVTTNGTPGSAGAYTEITVAASAPTLYYYCSVHSGMGGQANTNSTHGSSNFSGSIQSNVSANTTAGFSIVKYTGTESNATVGHGLGVAPSVIMVKRLSPSGTGWYVYHQSIGSGNVIFLNATNGSSSNSTVWNSTSPTTSVFSLGTNTGVNRSGDSHIAYCFAEKKGFSKFGSYTANGNTDGPFIYTGFKPAYILVKNSTSSVPPWIILDNKRNPYNQMNIGLKANSNDTDSDNSGNNACDFLSNGFKVRAVATGHLNNASGDNYIYMAFAEEPLVGTNNIPATAR